MAIKIENEKDVKNFLKRMSTSKKMMAKILLASMDVRGKDKQRIQSKYMDEFGGFGPQDRSETYLIEQLLKTLNERSLD
jgi:hypothetical protein